MGDQLKVDVLLGRLNSFLFKFNSDENMRANIKHAIRRFHEIPAVKYWMSLEKKYQREEKENGTMGIKSFKGWLAEQEEPMAKNIATTIKEEKRSPRTKNQGSRRTTRKTDYLTTEEEGKESSGITISFNDAGEAVCSMKNISFDNLKSLDGLLE